MKFRHQNLAYPCTALVNKRHFNSKIFMKKKMKVWITETYKDEVNLTSYINHSEPDPRCTITDRQLFSCMIKFDEGSYFKLMTSLGLQTTFNKSQSKIIFLFNPPCKADKTLSKKSPRRLFETKSFFVFSLFHKSTSLYK